MQGLQWCETACSTGWPVLKGGPWPPVCAALTPAHTVQVLPPQCGRGVQGNPSHSLVPSFSAGKKGQSPEGQAATLLPLHVEASHSVMARPRLPRGSRQSSHSFQKAALPVQWLHGRPHLGPQGHVQASLPGALGPHRHPASPGLQGSQHLPPAHQPHRTSPVAVVVAGLCVW